MAAAVWVAWATWAAWACNEQRIDALAVVARDLVYTKRTRRSQAPSPARRYSLVGLFQQPVTTTKAPSGAFVVGAIAKANEANSGERKLGVGIVLASTFHIKLRL